MADDSKIGAGTIIGLAILGGAVILAYAYRDNITAWLQAMFGGKVTPPADKHYECVNGKCALVDGAGASTCSKDSDCVNPPPVTMGYVDGTFKDSTYKPQSDVSITLQNNNIPSLKYTAKTNADGDFLMNNIPFGEYTITASKKCYDSYTEFMAVSSNSSHRTFSGNLFPASPENIQHPQDERSTVIYFCNKIPRTVFQIEIITHMEFGYAPYNPDRIVYCALIYPNGTTDNNSYLGYILFPHTSLINLIPEYRNETLNLLTSHFANGNLIQTQGQFIGVKMVLSDDALKWGNPFNRTVVNVEYKQS